MKIREVNLAGGLVRLTRDVSVECAEDMAAKGRRYLHERGDDDTTTTAAPTEVGSSSIKSSSMHTNIAGADDDAAAMNSKTIRWDSLA